MFKVTNNNIYLTRGDTAHLRVAVKTSSGEPYTLTENDVLQFTMKRRTSDREAIISKTFVDGAITIEPSDTAGLQIGDYKYDVQLTLANGEVNTIITPSTFTIGDEVTF